MPAELLAVLTILAAVIGWAVFRLRKEGVLQSLRRVRSRSRRIRRQDALKYLIGREMAGVRPSLEGMAGALGVPADRAAETLASLLHQGKVSFEAGIISLSQAGRDEARQILRAHRLWERYLADESGYPATDWHSRADRAEHWLSPEQVEALSAALGHPARDPHGDPIPMPEAGPRMTRGVPLAGAPQMTPLQIEHIEDEPEVVYGELEAHGLYAGMEVELIEVSPDSALIRAGGRELILPHILASNVYVRPWPEGQPRVAESSFPLSSLAQGESGRVVALSQRIRGAERRRLMDLGLLPGTPVRVELVSPSGDPVAYRVRGALIALRNDQTDEVFVGPMEAHD